MSTTDLTGRTAIVSGASRGFGRAIATTLTRHGAHVVGVARDESALEALTIELGASFTPVAADAADETLAARLIAAHAPNLVVLNAGATPTAASIRDHTWETFSENWQTDVRHVFTFVQAALTAPLAPGATVISMSSGAARAGSPLSGGYAGAKATIGFISSYAAALSDRDDLGIRFVSLHPKLTPTTGLGATFVDAYATYEGLDPTTYRERLGPPLLPEQVGDAVLTIATSDPQTARSYALTADGLVELP